MKTRAWVLPAVYAGAAIAAGLTFPRLELRFLPNLVAAVSASQATAIYSAIASGMIALTGIVFSLAFVMVQFSATAYSPRLTSLIARDPVLSHALGTFTATFLYAIAALAAVDRNGSGHVPFFSLWVVVALLVASVAMFIALVQRMGALQINRVLVFTGDQGRAAIARTYPPATSAVLPAASNEFRALSRTLTLVHHGPPRSVQSVDLAALAAAAAVAGGVIEVVAAVGDTVVDSLPLLHVFGGRQPADERVLLAAITIGDERTSDRDPKYAIRLLVDIAIRALSPAINDPTTGVQALDQILDLLIRLSRHALEIGECRDAGGALRVVAPCPSWDDFLRLAFGEICACGATSVQVMRRMNALVADLLAAVPEARRPALVHWENRIQATIARSFPDEDDRLDASMADRQGLGVPRRP
jgi:uncharacterized membrane protein